MIRETPRFATAPTPAHARLVRRLRRRLEGQAHVDPATCARYARDASPWQIAPAVVVTPANEADVLATLELAAEFGVSVVPRGSGCSIGGEALPQRAGTSLVIDASRHLDAIVDFDPRTRRVVVQPGITLATLNAFLAPHRLWLPFEGPGEAQASLGGLVGCDAIGARTIGSGRMARRLEWIDALLADGTRQRLGRFGVDGGTPLSGARAAALVSGLFERFARDRDALDARRSTARAAVGGYRLDALDPAGRAASDRPTDASGGRSADGVNLARLLAGSRGTLCWFERLCIELSPLPTHRRLVNAPFGDACAAMRSMPALAELNPAAAWLREDASLELEFHAAEEDGLARALAGVREIAAGGRLRGHDDPVSVDACWRAVRPVQADPAATAPGRLLETWLMPTGSLDAYATQVEAACAEAGVVARWGGAIGSGAPTLRVGPPGGAVRAAADDDAILASLASKVATLADRLGGAPVTEHGDDAVRRVAVARVHGAAALAAFEAVKDLFDPAGVLNPGKVVRATAREPMVLRRRAAPASARASDGRSVHADAGPNPAPPPPAPTLLALAGACDGNGTCRRTDADAMCPSFRVTRAERDGPRGRASTLRAAIEGRIGARGIADPAVNAALALCVQCKACRSACPNGVDVSRMKILALALGATASDAPASGERLRNHLIATLPLQLHRWRHARVLIVAALAARRLSPVAALVERIFGLRRDRSLPHWRADSFHDQERAGRAREAPPAPDDARAARTVVLWVDTFTDRSEPAIGHAVRRVLQAGGYTVVVARPAVDDAYPSRPLCCGRTFMQAGRLESARSEARRTLRALAPWLEAGVPVVGCEPACVLGFRDEYRWLGLGDPFDALAARLAEGSFLFEEFLVREHRAGRYRPRFGAVGSRGRHDPLADVAPASDGADRGDVDAKTRVLLQPHCHERAFGLDGAVRLVLGWVPDLEVETVAPGCCGMAGAFGYDVRHRTASTAMAALATLPAMAACDARTVVLADGASCRHQIRDGAGRRPMHTAELLATALPPG